MCQPVLDHAVMALVCTDRGQHREQVIEVLERDGVPGDRWSEVWPSARNVHDAVLIELLNRGVQLDDKLVKPNGQLESRHSSGVRNTRHGTECARSATGGTRSAE